MQKPLTKLNYNKSIHYVMKSTPSRTKHPADRHHTKLTREYSVDSRTD